MPSFNFENKLVAIYAFTIFAFVIITMRLIDTQLVNGESFEFLADRNRTFTFRLPEERGVILDRYQDPLLFNKTVYYQKESPNALYSPKTRVSREEALLLMIADENAVEIDYIRQYRYPESLSHITGYIGGVSSSNLEEDSSLHISDKVGKMGLELRYQDYLRGERGYKKFEVNALGEKQRLVEEKIGFPGKNLPITLDPYLSEIAYQAMGDKRGAVIILDVSTGEVLSLVSTPTFDVSLLSDSFTDPNQERNRVLTVQSFFSNPLQLFFNRGVSGAYPPGSVFKLFTALAGLENEKVTKNTTVIDEGVLRVGDFSYANWFYTQYGRTDGTISLVKAIARSNDIYFYKAAEWTGPENIKEMAELFGFGDRTNIEISSEVKGLVPSPEWKSRVVGERWFLGNTYHMGIGQGDLLTTPIQVAQGLQAIGNKGRLCQPTLIKDSFDQGYLQRNRCSEVGVLEDNLKLVLEGMINACEFGGTGFPFFAHNASVLGSSSDGRSTNPYANMTKGAVACKTGTSEFGGMDSRGYRRTHGWFVALFGTQDLLQKALKERENGEDVTNSVSDSVSDRDIWLSKIDEHDFPKELAIVVLVESDEASPYREGSGDAAPVVKAIFDWMFFGQELESFQVDEAPEYARE
jgi:penicillin-binding protein 2